MTLLVGQSLAATSLLFVLVLFPLLPMALGAAIRVRQNKVAHSTATTLPFTMCLAFVGHLISWWNRGPLELLMTYKWFNWSPRYGIAHALVHALFLVLMIAVAFISSEINRITTTVVILGYGHLFFQSIFVGKLLFAI